MNNINDLSIPLLFKILFVFLVLNIACNYLLYAISNRSIYKKLFIYWCSLVGVFFIEGIFQKGELAIALAHGSNIVPMTLLASIIYSTFRKKFPLKYLLPIYFVGIPITFLLAKLQYSFTVVALPFCIITALPLLMSSYLVYKNSLQATLFQKFIGIFFLLMPIHIVNFAVFRLDEGAQLWGWFTSWSIYQVLAVILPSFILEEVTRNENIRVANHTRLLEDKVRFLEQQLDADKLSSPDEDFILPSGRSSVKSERTEQFHQ